MPTVTVYASTDSSAPVLTGAVGSLNSLLDACLVSGYGGGSKSPAGWTKPYTGTNKAVFRMDTTAGNTGFYLNVDDAASGAGGAREALMTGFETMSAAGTGTNQFPTAAQLNLGSAPAGAVVCRKSNTADSTARAWTLVASNTFFYLFTESGDITNPTAASVFCFGDIISYKASDAYRCIIIGRNAANSALTTADEFGALLSPNATFSATISGHFIARHFNAAVGSVPVGKHYDLTGSGIVSGFATNSGNVGSSGTSGTSLAVGTNAFGFGQALLGLNYPNGPDGGLILASVCIHHGGSIRGYLPGCWSTRHDRPMNHNDTYSGTGNMSGKTFICQWIHAASGLIVPNNIGQVHIETSSTWG